MKQSQKLAVALPIIVGALIAVSISVALVHFAHPVPPDEKPIDNSYYEQQKADCLAGRIKCNPIAPTAY